MAVRTTPPFRADHVGSLLRPPSVLRAREALAAGRLTPAALRSIEDDAIRDVVQMQADVGLQTATDGEFRRASWHMDFIYRLGGIRPADHTLEVEFFNDDGALSFETAALSIHDRITLTETIFAADFSFLQANAGGLRPKLTIPSPSMVHYRGGPASIDRGVYPDHDQFWEDLSAAYAGEVAALAGLGCTYLQFDDTSLAYLNDPAQRRMLSDRGDDGGSQHLRYIHQINTALRAKPATMTVTTHLCRGNFRSSWAAAGGYDYVAEALFNELQVDGFFLEFDDARSGGFEPLRFVPKGKQVVLGLITSKRPALESVDELKRRIDEASRFVPMDQLCLSPQCGFSSTVEGNQLAYEEEVAKLRLVVDVAHDVWG
jgi:5-methyltetrahydropteroyltriglutamate--homocysteine methyltransferase